MDFENVRRFLGANHREEINTFQRDGAAQASVVVCGAFHEDVVFVSVMGDSATIRNLRRDPRCTVLAVREDWVSYAVVEGRARLFDAATTKAEELTRLLRDCYRACGDAEHRDWDDYDRAMLRQKAVAVAGASGPYLRPDPLITEIRQT